MARGILKARVVSTAAPPHALEVTYAQSVEKIILLIQSELAKLEAIALTRALDGRERGQLVDLARACQSLQGNTLAAARGILDRWSKQGKATG